MLGRGGELQPGGQLEKTRVPMHGRAVAARGGVNGPPAGGWKLPLKAAVPTGVKVDAASTAAGGCVLSTTATLAQRQLRCYQTTP